MKKILVCDDDFLTIQLIEKNFKEENFSYSILDIYKSTIDDNIILKRETWWKNTLLTRKFGYNKN